MRQNRVIVRFLRIALVCLMLGSMVGAFPSTASAAKFNIGDIVRTTNELYVRQGAGTGYTTVKLMHANTAGVVLQGPQAADGYTWWKVRYDDDVEGWSSDHRLEKYARASPKFSVGHNVQTTGELHVRSKPGLDYTILKIQPAGVTGTILDFPVPRPRVVDGYDWWKVRYSDGTQGWSSDHRLQKYTAPPDLTVTSVSAPSSAKVEDTILVSFTVKNQGGSSSGSFSNRVSLATSAWGTTYSLGNFSMSSLGADASSTKTVSVTIPSVSPGYYYVTVFTDGFQAIAESNENNNIGSTYPSRISITKPTLKYTLTTSVSPWGSGSVSPGNGSYDEGTRVTLTASPASGYIFDHWGGDASGTSTTVTITMNSNKSITAYFVQDTGTINVTSTPSGAPFNLSGPASYSGTTPWTNTNALVGTYTIIWDPLTGYGTPPSETKTLERDGTISFHGVYQPVTETVSAPNTPSGSTSGTTGTSYTYSTGGASSNLGHSLKYRFDWGDGTYSSWSSSTSASHSWPAQGTYAIRAQARCATHTSALSGWSGGKSVTISSPVPTPQITGVDPAQPEVQPTKQWIGILGTGFVSESEVILRIGTSEYPIPPERTHFVSATRINIFVGLTDPGTWTAQVINPGNRQSNVFSFTTDSAPAIVPSQILSPLIGQLEVASASDTKWYFNQHKEMFGNVGHGPGGGVGLADDTFAWDVHLDYPNDDSDAGKPVYAVASGVVTDTYGGRINAGGSSGQVLLEHTYQGSKWWSGYLHLSNIQVSPGQTVTEDTILGYISDVGASNNHLHFVVYTGSNTLGGLVSFNAAIVERAGPTITDDQKQQDMLNMVNNHRGSIPPELVLAVIRQEGGEGAFHTNGWNYDWFYDESDGPWAQPTNGYGIMQVEYEPLRTSGAYTNDQSGYDHAINDGSNYLLDNYNSYGSYVQATLHYNTGPSSLYIYLGLNAGDRDYLSNVAGHLSNFVPNTYSLQNQDLVSALNQGQTILDDYLDNMGIAAGQPASYYLSYQAELDNDLNNIGTLYPIVESFNVQPGSVTLGNAFTISYTVSDTGGSGLNRVELWRKSDTVDWKEIERTSLVGAGDGPYSGSFSNVPFSTGTYWYGIHVVDNASNWNDERNSHTAGLPGIFGPIKIEVIPTPTVYAVEHILTVLDAYFASKPSELLGGKVPTVDDVFNLLDAYFSS